MSSRTAPWFRRKTFIRTNIVRLDPDDPASTPLRVDKAFPSKGVRPTRERVLRSCDLPESPLVMVGERVDLFGHLGTG